MKISSVAIFEGESTPMLRHAMSTEPLSVLPLLAPLSESMTAQAFFVQEGKKGNPRQVTWLSLEQQDLLASWARIYQRFRPIRNEAYHLTADALKSGDYSTRWIIAELSKRYPEKSKPVSHETISRWRTTGLLPYQKEDFPDPDRAIAMLILRELITAKANAWTPKLPKNGSFWKEALWTCWRQDTPTSPILPCAIPLPPDLPHHTLLWTSYLGADLKSPLWLRIGDLGCCRWAQVKEYHNTLIWDITEEDLQVWGITIENYSKEMEKDTPLTLHMLANLALLQLATERLEGEQSIFTV